MPIYEYECPIHGIFERIFLSREYDYISDRSTCIEEKCIEVCLRIWSLPANPQIGKPSIVFKNPRTGETRIATSDYEPPPNGFIKEELKGPFERSKFEKEESEKTKVADELVTYKTQQRIEESRKRRHEDLKSKMSSIASKTDNPQATESLLKKAMNRNKKREVPKRKTDFRFQVNK